jgi:PiT family inorganic phosphate transporter
MLLILAALGFSLVSGANDGATLITLILSNRALRPLVSIAILTAAVTLAPLAIGTSVATTIARGLVRFEGESGRSALLVAVSAALAVVLVLQRRGIPTSLTLALTGGIVGSGLGAGLPVGWGAVALTLGLGIVAPLVSAGVATVSMHLITLAPRRAFVMRRLDRLQALTFVVQCLAYAGNDAQKMVALIAVGAGTIDPAVRTAPIAMLAVGGCFALGTLFGLQRIAPSLGRGMLTLRPEYAALGEFSGALSVLGSAAVGAPISSTQATAGGLVGAGMSDTYHRVRWQQVTRIAGAWVATLPTSALIAALLASTVLPAR